MAPFHISIYVVFQKSDYITIFSTYNLRIAKMGAGRYSDEEIREIAKIVMKYPGYL